MSCFVLLDHQQQQQQQQRPRVITPTPRVTSKGAEHSQYQTTASRVRKNLVTKMGSADIQSITITSAQTVTQPKPHTTYTIQGGSRRIDGSQELTWSVDADTHLDYRQALQRFRSVTYRVGRFDLQDPSRRSSA
jgi:hypothetical protein